MLASGFFLTLIVSIAASGACVGTKRFAVRYFADYFMRVTAMVQMTSGILGAVAATLAFGAVHLEVAAGNDLLGPRRLVSAQDSFPDATRQVPDPNEFGVNRAAKADRAGAPAFASSESMTLSFGLANVPATSIVMRVPVKDAALPSQVKPSAASNSQARNIAPRGARMVACEPSVSLLAPVARQLEPSRCVT